MMKKLQVVCRLIVAVEFISKVKDRRWKIKMQSGIRFDVREREQNI